MLDEKKLVKSIKSVKPSEKFARNLIKNLPVTKIGRESLFIMKIKNLTTHNIMTKPMAPLWGWRFLVPAATIAIVIAIVGIGKFALRAPGEIAIEPSAEFSQEIAKHADEAVKSAPEASGDFNDAVEAMLAFSDSEEILLAEELSDVELIAAEIDAANNLSESYDENEL
jgi:hypothetical protein